MAAGPVCLPSDPDVCVLCVCLQVAIELEDPFGDDENDLPMNEYQKIFNQRLRPLLFLDEGPFRTPALEVSFAAMASTYDSRGPGPLSASAMMQPGGYLEQMGVDGIQQRSKGHDDEEDLEKGPEEEVVAGESDGDSDEEMEPFAINWVIDSLDANLHISLAPVC